MPNVSEDKNNYAYKLAQQYAERYKDWRWGQCVFNAYVTVFPEIANSVRGTNDDCIYNDRLVPAFLSHFVSTLDSYTSENNTK